jgi:probable addiction module antidote protein
MVTPGYVSGMDSRFRGNDGFFGSFHSAVGIRPSLTMALETFPFDAAQHLTDAEDQAGLLNEALASGDAAAIAAALGIIARARGMTEVSREAGVTREALYKSLSAKGDPRLTTLLGVMRALGVTLTARIKPAA